MKDIPPIPQVADAAPNPLRETREKLEQAEALRREGKFDRAEAICSALVRRYPDYFAALHTLGLIHADRNDHQRAAGILFRAAMLNPRSWMTLTALSGVCLSLDAKEMAAQILEQARRINPRDAGVLVTLGEIYREEREYEFARDAYRQALELEPDFEAANIGLALASMSLGENAEAAEVLNRILLRGGQSLGLLSVLVLLPPAMIHWDVLAEMEGLIRSANEDPVEFENTAGFIRAAALDKAGRHAEAWEVLRAVNRMRFDHIRKELQELKEGERLSLKQLRDARATAGPGREEKTNSLFILGPSRSGKTSLEGLVGMLDGVKRGYENPSLENAISRTFQNAGLLTTWSLDPLPPQFYPQCREIYLEELTQRAASARVFTNTHPMHIHAAARLPSVLGNVRFIFVKRNMDDVMLRIYMRNYRQGNPYAYSLESIRDHVVWYHEMMDLMAEKFPDIVRIVRYEDMVEDPAGALRVAAELCGLPMTDKPLPALGDDRGCAAPYREFIAAALER